MRVDRVTEEEIKCARATERKMKSDRETVRGERPCYHVMSKQ